MVDSIASAETIGSEDNRGTLGVDEFDIDMRKPSTFAAGATGIDPCWKEKFIEDAATMTVGSAAIMLNLSTMTIFQDKIIEAMRWYLHNEPFHARTSRCVQDNIEYYRSKER